MNTVTTCAKCYHSTSPLPADWTTVDFFDKPVIAQEAVFRTTCTAVPDAKKPCLKPATATTAQVTTEKLQHTIRGMDGMAQDALSEIAAIAKLLLASLENPVVCYDSNTIARALGAIRSKALDAENCITAYAEEMGCNYVDEAFMRRIAARRQPRAEGRA